MKYVWMILSLLGAILGINWLLDRGRSMRAHLKAKKRRKAIKLVIEKHKSRTESLGERVKDYYETIDKYSDDSESNDSSDS